MAASFKFNRKLPNLFRHYVLEKKIFTHANREISKCSVCLSKAKGKYKNNEDKPSLVPNNGDGSQKIIVPRKIERSPTAILEALASTVKNDVNKPIYLALDDPQLLPLTDRSKKNFMAAKDNGRKAAQMMLSLYPDYFTQIWQDALPEAYSYDPYQGYQHKEANEAALLERIKTKQVKDAFDVYQTCKKKGINLSQDVQEHLLELLTVYNCNEPDKISDLNSFIDPNFEKLVGGYVRRSSWMRGNEAEVVFNSLPEKTVTAYNNLLRGIANNYDEEAAFKLYYEMKEQNIPVDLYSYNKLILGASVNKETVEDAIQIIQSLLQDMKEAGVHPTLETFNASISSLKSFWKWTKAQQFSFSIISEMVACGIEPELSTFNLLVGMLYYKKDKSKKDPALIESILNYMEGKEYEIKSVDSALFFDSTIKSLSVHCPDSSYALRLTDILRTGNNFKALSGRHFLFSYYQKLFEIITPLEHTDVVMEIFDSVVPHLFNPPLEIYVLIFENISLNETHHYLPQIYEVIHSCIHSGLLNREKLLTAFIQCLASKKHETELQEKIADIASLIIENYKEDKEQNNNYNSVGLNGSCIGDLILTFLNNEDPEKALDTYKMCKDDGKLQRQSLSEESLTSLTKHCISVKDYKLVQELLNKMIQGNNPSKVSELVDLLLAESTEFSEQDRNFYLGLKQDAQSYIQKENKKKRSSKKTKKLEAVKETFSQS